MKEEKLPHTRKPLHWWKQEGGCFRAKEESAATGVQRAKWRDYHTEDWYQSALTSLRRFSAHLAGWGWELRLGLWRSDPRERTGVGCMKTALSWLVRHR